MRALLLSLLFFLPVFAAISAEPEGDRQNTAVRFSAGDVPPRLEYAAIAESLYPEVRVRVTAPRHVVLSTEIGGKINTVGVREGELFDEGHLLVGIDPAFESIQYDKAAAFFRRQEIVVSVNRELVEMNTRGELELQIALAELEQARAELRFAQARLERTRLSAPFAGRVGDIFVKEGQVVSEGQPVLEVIDESLLELEFIVSSMWMRWFKPGFSFTVAIDETGTRHEAVLQRIAGKVDPLGKSVKAYAVFAGAVQGLMEGMSGEAFIVQPEENGQ